MQDPEGLYRVGYFLRKGMIDGFQLSQGRLDNRDKELEESVLYLQQAGEQGHLEALTELGEVFEHGLASETQEDVMLAQPELEQAEFYYNQGKKMRYPKAIWALGQFYLNHPDYKEKVVGDNSRKALKYFELAKDLGFEKAYLSLARCYENGLGIQPNLEKAKNYYKEGSLRGDSECKVSYMYYMVQEASNKGKHEDYQTVYNYLREVLITSPEIPETYYYLGHLYECGFGVNKDPGSALQFYFKGSKLRNASCMNKLGDFYHSGYGVPRNQREALKYYQMAAELQDPAALINMGVIYENGYEGVKPEQVKAFNCYEQAAGLNYPKAYFHLGLMYEAGRYVKQDINYAIELYKKSA